MCFSAEASFLVGGACGLSGAVCVARVPSRRYLPLASMPLVFGIQQMSEGFVWLGLNGDQSVAGAFHPAIVFLVTATVFWPVFTPLAVWLAERSTDRRLVFRALLLVGFCVGLVNALKLVGAHVDVQQVGPSLIYSVIPADGLPPSPASRLAGIWSDWILLPYAAATVGSLFLSGYWQIRALGTLLAVSLAALLVMDRIHIVSVWCFVAAASSLVLVQMVFGARAFSGRFDGSQRGARTGHG